MKKQLIRLTLALAIPCSSFAQYHWDLGGSLGASNYLGDIGGKQQTRRDFVADLKFSQTHFAGDVFARYRFTPFISLKTSFAYGRLSGADALSTNPGREGRNLSFRNDIFELAATAEFCFFSTQDVGHSFRYANSFKAYCFAGIGGFYNDPKANYNGEWIALQPLMTEGVSYSKYQLAIPAGIGFYYTFNKVNRVGWELGWRTTFTDYIDDISTVYADPSKLSPEAAKLANRHNELPPSVSSELPSGNNYTAGCKRGDPTHNDSYIFSSFSYSYVIKGQSTMGKNWNHLHPRYKDIVFNDKFGHWRKRKHRIFI